MNRKEISILKNSLNIEDLSLRCKRGLLQIMYSQSKQPLNIQKGDSKMSLRNSKNVKLKSDFTRLTKIQGSPYYRDLKLWNTLPKNIQKEQNDIKVQGECQKTNQMNSTSYQCVFLKDCVFTN